MKKIFKVAQIKDSKNLVINAGSKDGIKENQRFIIYSLDGEEIIDPDTGEFLGNLEVVKGTGTVSFLFEKHCTITSDIYKKYSPMEIHAFSLTTPITQEEKKNGKHCPFENPKVGDLAKPI